jgi:hypothetical protein
MRIRIWRIASILLLLLMLLLLLHYRLSLRRHAVPILRVARLRVVVRRRVRIAVWRIGIGIAAVRRGVIINIVVVVHCLEKP